MPDHLICAKFTKKQPIWDCKPKRQSKKPTADGKWPTPHKMHKKQTEGQPVKRPKDSHIDRQRSMYIQTYLVSKSVFASSGSPSQRPESYLGLVDHAISKTSRKRYLCPGTSDAQTFSDCCWSNLSTRTPSLALILIISKGLAEWSKPEHKHIQWKTTH